MNFYHVYPTFSHYPSRISPYLLILSSSLILPYLYYLFPLIVHLFFILKLKFKSENSNINFEHIN
ncbi:hypothetical protein CFK35_09845 [Clostridium sp. cpc1]|nr:hypothetical protein [Clostridium sp. cpc1]